MHTLKKVGYNGWVNADVFPGRHDPIETMSKTFDWTDKTTDIAEKTNGAALSEMRQRCETYEILDYI